MKETEIRFFDDEKRSKLLPLVYTRDICDLVLGICSLRQKFEIRAKKSKLSGKHVIFINSRVISDDKFVTLVLRHSKTETALFSKDELAAVIVEKDKAAIFEGKQHFSAKMFDGLPIKKEMISADFINYPWDLVHRNTTEIVADVKLLKLKPFLQIKYFPGMLMVNRSSVFVGKGCKIKPGVVLDAEEGPVVIDDGAIVMANATIIGPAYIGKNAIIKAGAKIYGGTTICAKCKIGGEVEGSVFLPHSNKQHDGFIGHSYICEWVNLGAGTSNSDLKNNYSNVKMFNDGAVVDTGSLFMGLVIGDHSKSAINTSFNTGTVVGVFSNLFGAGFMPKNVPSFSWGGTGDMNEHSVEKAIATAKTVMDRRKVQLSKDYEKRIREIFKETALDREKLDLS